MGRREGRMFDAGELRLVILALVAEKPRYGYEIIKELGERVGGRISMVSVSVDPANDTPQALMTASENPDVAGLMAMPRRWAERIRVIVDKR